MDEKRQNRWRLELPAGKVVSQVFDIINAKTPVPVQGTRERVAAEFAAIKGELSYMSEDTADYYPSAMPQVVGIWSEISLRGTAEGIAEELDKLARVFRAADSEAVCTFEVKWRKEDSEED